MLSQFPSYRVLQICSAMLICLMAGCKIQIETPLYVGSSIASDSGAYQCEPGQESCVIDVVDIFFDETFTASPNNGFQFREWAVGEGALCGRRTEPCRLTTSLFESFPALIAILESDEVFRLIAVFEPLPAPEGHINVVGRWSYTRQNGSCMASGEVETWLEEGLGWYQRFTPGSTNIQDPLTCSLGVTPTDPPVLGPLSLVMEAVVSEAFLQSVWEVLAAGGSARVLNENQFSTTAGGETTTFTRLELASSSL